VGNGDWLVPIMSLSLGFKDGVYINYSYSCWTIGDCIEYYHSRFSDDSWVPNTTMLLWESNLHFRDELPGADIGWLFKVLLVK
jgi:hypothetical protein